MLAGRIWRIFSPRLEPVAAGVPPEREQSFGGGGGLAQSDLP